MTSFLRLVLFLTLAAGAATGQLVPVVPGVSVPASCPIAHRPATPFVPSAPYREIDSDRALAGFFFVGTDGLFATLRDPMVWRWAPHPQGQEQSLYPITAMLVWHRVGYKAKKEPFPDLKLTGRRLDGPSLPPVFARPSNALSPEGGVMASGVYLPSPGCWEITAEYEAEKLSYVVWVAMDQGRLKR
jgi:hypothetical protein